jgi:uncharacterized surface protein with fasciclin (FAS1) repeats
MLIPSSSKQTTQTVAHTLKELGKFDYLLQAFRNSQLQKEIESAALLTLFAPWDEAFEKLPVNFMTSLITQKLRLNAFLGYHILDDSVWTDDLRNMEIAKTHSGKLLRIELTGEMIILDGANLVLPDIPCSNGIIHVIDAVMWPK